MFVASTITVRCSSGIRNGVDQFPILPLLPEHLGRLFVVSVKRRWIMLPDRWRITPSPSFRRRKPDGWAKVAHSRNCRLSTSCLADDLTLAIFGRGPPAIADSQVFATMPA